MSVGSPDERLARVSYFPGVRPPLDGEAHPAGAHAGARGDEGWHVDGVDRYRDEQSEPAGPPEAEMGESSANSWSGPGTSVADPDGERLSPRHPAGKGRSRRGALRPMTPTPDEQSRPAGSPMEGGPQPAAATGSAAHADPRQASALERMSRHVAAVDHARDEAPESEPEPEPEPDDEALAARAERISMHALTRRGVSSTELRRTLASRELPEHIVEAEIDRLVRVGLLDDAELAATLVRTLTERKGLGRQALSSELRRRGIDSDTVTAALDELDGDDEGARADELARKRAGQLRSLDRATAERRLVAFLQRKGYSGSVSASAARKALGSSSSGVRFE